MTFKIFGLVNCNRSLCRSRLHCTAASKDAPRDDGTDLTAQTLIWNRHGEVRSHLCQTSAAVSNKTPMSLHLSPHQTFRKTSHLQLIPIALLYPKHL